MRNNFEKTWFILFNLSHIFALYFFAAAGILFASICNGLISFLKLNIALSDIIIYILILTPTIFYKLYFFPKKLIEYSNKFPDTKVAGFLKHRSSGVNTALYFMSFLMTDIIANAVIAWGFFKITAVITYIDSFTFFGLLQLISGGGLFVSYLIVFLWFRENKKLSAS